MRHAVYSNDAPPSQPSLWSIFHDLKAILKAERFDWIYKDRLHVRLPDREVVIVADMRNSQFVGADTSISAFSLGYEPDIAISIDTLVPDDGVLIDVGANWGYFPVYLGSRPGFTGRILAIEPFPLSYEGLQAVISATGLGDVVEAAPVAAGQATGPVSMSEELFTGNNRVTGEQGVVPVEQTTLDLLARRSPLGRVDFVKIDVEGSEADVIIGARDTIGAYRPAVMFEDWFDADALKSTNPFSEIAKIGGYRFYVVEVAPRFRPAQGKSDGRADAAPALLVDCLVSVSELDPPDRDKWPDRINVLALPASNDFLDRLAAREKQRSN